MTFFSLFLGEISSRNQVPQVTKHSVCDARPRYVKLSKKLCSVYLEKYSVDSNNKD